jgi:hypothetical protein
VGFVVDKVALEQVFSETSVSPANSHSTDCSTHIIYHLGHLMAEVTSGLSLAILQEIKEI